MVSCSLLVFILLLRKFTKIVASRAAVFGSDISQIVRRLGRRPRHHYGTYSAPPDPIAVFSGPTSRERKGGKGRRGGEGRGGGAPIEMMPPKPKF